MTSIQKNTTFVENIIMSTPKLYLRSWVSEQHDNVNQKYDGRSYMFHIQAVLSQVVTFNHLLDSGNLEDEIVYAAAMCHDILEDTNNTYNDLFDKLVSLGFGDCIEICEVVYCVTDEKGRNRAERKNERYYTELRDNKLAVFVKLCDIIANTLYSRLTGSSMYKKYKKEFPDVKEKLYLPEYDEMFNYLENL